MADTVTYDDAVIYDALDVTFDGEDLSKTTTVILGGRPRAASAATHAGAATSTLRSSARAVGVGAKASTATGLVRAPGRFAATAQKAASAVVVLRASGSAALVGVALELQYAAPVADLDDGNWVNELGSATDLYASIDEPTVEIGDYIQSSLSPLVADECRIILAGLDDPGVDTDHTLRVWVRKDTVGGDEVELTITLYAADGTTVIRTEGPIDVGFPALVEIVLTEGEAAAIPAADYSTGLVVGFSAVKV